MVFGASGRSLGFEEMRWGPQGGVRGLCPVGTVRGQPSARQEEGARPHPPAPRFGAPAPRAVRRKCVWFQPRPVAFRPGRRVPGPEGQTQGPPHHRSARQGASFPHLTGEDPAVSSHTWGAQLQREEPGLRPRTPTIPAPQFCLSRLRWSRCDQDLPSPHTWGGGSMGTGAPGKATRGPCLPAQQPGDVAPLQSLAASRTQTRCRPQKQRWPQSQTRRASSPGRALWLSEAAGK